MKNYIALALLTPALACTTTEEKPDPVVVEKPAPVEKTVETASYKDMVESYNAGNYDAALAMFTADVVATSTGESGTDALKKRWEEAAPLSPQVAVSRYVEADGVWIAEGVMHGAHTAEYRGVGATNKKYSIPYVHVGRVNDAGKTKELLAILNSWSIAAQLEMMKGPPAPPMAALPSSTEMVKGDADATAIAAARAVYAAYEGGKFDELAAHIAEDAVIDMKAHGKVYTGLDAIKEAMGKERNAFTERTAETEIVAAGDVVVVFGKVTAKHTGQAGPTPPTGKMVSWHFADVLKFTDGKLVSGAFYYNPGEVMRQLK